MPGINGFEACRRLKKNPASSTIPVVFFTKKDNIEEKKQGFSLGAVDYITKPVEREELVARITVHLGQHRIQLNLQRRLALYMERFGAMEPLNKTTSSDDIPEHHVARVNQAMEILLANLVTPPSLEELASLVNTNAKRLSKDFQILYGMTAFAWLKERRLQQAAGLLRSSLMPIARIADQLGFSSSANLATAFKTRFQLTPRQYRKSAIS